MSQAARKSSLTILAVLTGGALLGGLFGGRVQADSKRPEDQLFSAATVGYGSFSGCIFMVDLDQDLVIAQARRRTGPRWGVWAARYFQTIEEALDNDSVATP